MKTSTGQTKVYVALFSCCLTRAIHFEVVEDCSKEQFSLLCRRFCAMISIPTTIVTDNASCFLSGEDEITQLLDEPEVKAYLNSNVYGGYTSRDAPQPGAVSANGWLEPCALRKSWTFNAYPV